MQALLPKFRPLYDFINTCSFFTYSAAPPLDVYVLRDSYTLTGNNLVTALTHHRCHPRLYPTNHA